MWTRSATAPACSKANCGLAVAVGAGGAEDQDVRGGHGEKSVETGGLCLTGERSTGPLSVVTSHGRPAQPVTARRIGLPVARHFSTSHHPAGSGIFFPFFSVNPLTLRPPTAIIHLVRMQRVASRNRRRRVTSVNAVDSSRAIFDKLVA